MKQSPHNWVVFHPHMYIYIYIPHWVVYGCFQKIGVPQNRWFNLVYNGKPY